MRESPWFMGNWITVCIRCLYSLRSEKESAQATILDEEVWVCADVEKCPERQEANRRRHRREIDHRLRYLKPRHTLVVVLDKFGNIYGYGNYYITVKPGDDLETVIRENEDNPNLVVSEVIHKAA